jgi:hypothetical protein
MQTTALAAETVGIQDSHPAIMGSAASNPIVLPLNKVAILMAAGHTKTVLAITVTMTVLPTEIAALAPAPLTRAGTILVSSAPMSGATTQTGMMRAAHEESIAKIRVIPIRDHRIATGIKVEAINNVGLTAITGKDATLTGIIALLAAMSGITGLTAMSQGQIHAIHAGRVARRRSAEITRGHRKSLQSIHQKMSYSKAITSISIRLTLPRAPRNTGEKTKITEDRQRNAM